MKETGFSNATVFHAAIIVLAALLLAAKTVPALAQQQRRVALVIGNNEYENVPKLRKATNDADAVSKELADVGFTVTTAKDIGRRAMSRAVLEFEKHIREGDLALFYYAGHGFAVSGQNFLLPVDIPSAGPGEESLVRDEAFLADDLSIRFQRAGARTVVLVLDACRNNPFELPGRRSLTGPTGLARMAPSEGVFVLFSAGIGQAALDDLGPQDNNPNSVFTREFLAELARPGASIVEVAKATQVAVRDLAAQVDYVQTPAYYDQIIGSVTLNPAAGGVPQRGNTRTFREGSTTAMLPSVDLKPRAGKGKPIVSFTRSNSGWLVSVSLPEPAIQFGYRIGKEGEFVDTGTSANIDPNTGAPAPVTSFVLPPDQPPGDIYVTWRDRRGEEAGVFPISFEPDQALKIGQKRILDSLWTSWVSFRQYNGLLVYFTQLVSYRCAVDRIEYALDDSGRFQTWRLPKCDPDDPNRIPDGAELYKKIPPGTKSMQVVVTYFDGTRSPERNFSVRY